MAKSNLLMTEQPIVINRELAKIVGLNEAIVLQQMEYWININEKAEKESAYNEGFYWTYNTVQEWQEQFPFWSYDTVKRVLGKLRKKGILITDRFNKKSFDRTLWYRINYEKLNELEKNPSSNRANCTNEETWDFKTQKTCKPLKKANSAKCTNTIGQNAPMEQGNLHQTIPEINTKNTTKIISSSSRGADIQLIPIFNNEICELKKTTSVKFLEYVNTYNADFIKAVIEYCSETSIRSFAGFKKVIDSYINKNILTRNELTIDIEKFRADRKAKQEQRNNSKKQYINNNYTKIDTFNDYDQREYDFDELEIQLLGLETIDKVYTEDISELVLHE